MAKKSRKQRKLLNQTVQSDKKAYYRHKKRFCRHYSYEALTIGYLQTYLNLQGDVYVCSECGKVFTSEQEDRLEAFCNYLLQDSKRLPEKAIELLSPEIMPCEYYYIASDTPEISDLVEENMTAFTNQFEKDRMKTEKETIEALKLIIEKAKSNTLQIKNAEQIFGEPHTIFFEFPAHIWDSHLAFPYYDTEALKEILLNSKDAEDAYKKLGKALSKSFKNFKNIIYREDLFEYLINSGHTHQQAYSAMKIICERGKFPTLFNWLNTHSKTTPDEFTSWKNAVAYLPSRKLIWDIFS